ncbi:MAG: peptide chain release factor N(5)-glutamine methyltransferase [Bacillota bacterium]|nr:peptide chain release factor N(5)-glutamine methyltransferase [Bacillota bacterium]
MVVKTIKKTVAEGIKKLNKREFNNPFLEAYMILEYLLNKEKLFLITHEDEEIEEETYRRYLELIEKRNTGYPIQYIIHNQEFMGINFYLDEDVLIPRPDTEVLVENAIKIAKSDYFSHKNIKALDIGTGSGAIAVSFGYYCRDAEVLGVDINPKAVEIARKNVKENKLDNVNIIKGDLFMEKFDFPNEKYDIIMSNPPYIKSEDIKKLQLEVSQYEPKNALDGGDSGLKFHSQILKIIPNYLNDKSVLIMEIGWDQAKEVVDIMRKIKGFKKVEVRKDIAKKDRIVIGYYNRLEV